MWRFLRELPWERLTHKSWSGVFPWTGRPGRRAVNRSPKSRHPLQRRPSTGVGRSHQASIPHEKVPPKSLGPEPSPNWPGGERHAPCMLLFLMTGRPVFQVTCNSGQTAGPADRTDPSISDQHLRASHGSGVSQTLRHMDNATPGHYNHCSEGITSGHRSFARTIVTTPTKYQSALIG